MNANTAQKITALETGRGLGMNMHPSYGVNSRGKSPKKPAGQWKECQTDPMPLAEARATLAAKDSRGIGILTGTQPENGRHLVAVDIEGRGVANGKYATWREQMTDRGYGELLTRLDTGYAETSPSGGVHLLVYTEVLAATEKWCFSPDTDPDTGTHRTDPRGNLLWADDAEVRADGAYIVTAPTTGYAVTGGALDTVPDVTPTEYAAMRDSWRVLCQKTAHEESVADQRTDENYRVGDTGQRPGDLFNSREAWEDVLEGWTRTDTKHGPHGEYAEWVRPGKSPRDGISGTTNHLGTDRFVNFSSNAPEFESAAGTGGKRTSYDKFSVYAILNHGGDYRAAARAVASMYDMPAVRKVGASDVSEYFDPREGLKVLDTLAAVETQGKLATDTGGHVYAYDNGTWRTDGLRVLAGRLTGLLGNRMRWGHRAAVESVLSGREPLFTDDTADTRFLNVPNGLVDWATGKLHPHSDTVPNKNRLPVEWHPGATCPKIDKFLSEVLPADAIGTAYEVIGYALYNGNPLEKAILLHASGRNGKGTFLRLIQSLLGADNYSTVTPQGLSERFAVAELYGMLANIAGDVDSRMFRQTEVLKSVTGRDVVRAERKGQQPFKFEARALMIAAFNELPRSADTTEGFFSRWLVLPFTGYFGPGKADPTLKDKLTDTAELEGLLVKAVAGLRNLIARGQFAEPESAARARTAFEEEADPVRSFAAEWCEVTGNTDDHRVEQNWLYDRYAHWCREAGIKSPLTRRRFNAGLRAAKPILGKLKSAGDQYFTGLVYTGPAPLKLDM